MRRCVLLVALLIGLIETASAGTESLPPKFQLTWVRFKGVRNVSAKELAATLTARVPPFWKFWLKGPILDAVDLEDDRIRIRKFYEKHGYYHSQVEVLTEISRPATPETPPSDELSPPSLPRVKVTFKITEGPPVVVTAIEVQPKRAIDGWNQSELLATLPLQIGQVFNAADYDATKKRVARYVGIRGHPFANVTGKATIDAVKNQAVVFIGVDGGPLCRFGPVEIDQADNAVALIIVRRALTIKENEIYDVSKVEKSRSNLLKLDVFRLVIFKPEGPPETEGGQVPIVLKLESKPRHSLQAGIGYGTEEKLRLQGAWTYRNAFAHAGNSTLEARYSDLIESLKLYFEQPYLWDNKNNWMVSSGYEKEKLPAYTNRKILANTRITRNFWEKVTGQLGYGLEYNDVENVNLVAIDPEDRELFAERNKYLISAIFSQLARDTRDTRLNPSQGSLLAGSVGWASRLFGSELQYVQPAVEGRIYYPFLENLIGSGRLRLETIQETETSEFIPINKRLFLGGSNTVRGYGFQEVPPLDAAGNPIGGRTALNTNLEMRYPIYEELSGVIFLDTGLIDLQPFSLSLSDTRYSCGLGIRYDTIVGPLRVDFGYNLNPPTGADIGDTDNPDEVVGKRWQIYFSIGQAF